MKRMVRLALAIGAVTLVLGTTWWALTGLLEPSGSATETTSGPVLYKVVTGSLGRSLDLVVHAHWETTPLGPIGRSGLVTSVEFVGPADIDEGDILFTLDLRPVVVVEGTVPSFRRLQRGDIGQDVRQLQRFLINEGLLTGDVTDRFDLATERAVKAWQSREAPDLKPTGVVELGDLLFVTSLPARAALASFVRVGESLDGSQRPLLSVADEPTFTLLLGPNQADLVRPGIRVSVDQHPWVGEIGMVSPDPDTGGFEVSVVSPTGRLCQDSCDQIPLSDAGVIYPAKVEIVPNTRGPLVPVSALVSDAAGDSGVISSDGSYVRVNVVVTDGGFAIVEGVQAGQVIRVHGDGG